MPGWGEPAFSGWPRHPRNAPTASSPTVVTAQVTAWPDNRIAPDDAIVVVSRVWDSADGRPPDAKCSDLQAGGANPWRTVSGQKLEYDDLAHTPDDSRRYELLDGTLVVTLPQTPLH